jgi:glycosyltransferase involved in cell wall biosynthesis
MERYKNSVFIHRSHGFEGRVAYELNRWTKDFYQDNRSIMKRYLSNCLGKLLNIHNMLIARFATGHIVSASECKDFMRLEYGISEERIAIIPQAPPDDYHFYPVPSLDSERLRRVLYVGQYAFVKAPMILARTIERLLETRPEVYFTWVCGKQHHAEAQALFSNRSILSRINFEGWCDQMSLRSIYDQHGIFLFPSFFEGFGKAFIEAMSRGLVVVAANNGGMKDVITDGKNGILIETGDDRAMARACAYLIENPDLASAISNEGRRHANNYTWRRVADETIDFYQRLLSALDYGQTHHRDGSC